MDVKVIITIERCSSVLLREDSVFELGNERHKNKPCMNLLFYAPNSLRPYFSTPKTKTVSRLSWSKSKA